jgi:hypothetical protein
VLMLLIFFMPDGVLGMILKSGVRRQGVGEGLDY